MSAEGSNVKVICRIRPLNQRERDTQTPGSPRCNIVVVTFVDSASNSLTLEGPETGKHTFAFDSVFDIDTTQDLIFKKSVQEIGNDLFKGPNSSYPGFNATIFAYGQTGAGKTFTMQGILFIKNKAPKLPILCCRESFPASW